MKSWGIPAAAAAFGTALLLAAPQAQAVTLAFDNNVCGGSSGAGACTASNANVIATAYQITEIASGGNSTAWTNYTNAFNSWNADTTANRGGGGAWTLQTGNLSGEATFDVTTYRAYVGDCGAFCGGAEINVVYKDGGNVPLQGTADWSQSIATNQKLAGSLAGNPYLDNPSGLSGNNLFAPPLYPFQYTDSSLYDKPGRDATANWLADAYISTADYTKHVLTVYDGIEWGFNVVPVPEPSTWAMLLIGMAGLGFAGYRRSRRGVAIAT
jgi:hypothetical protein